MNPKIPKQNSTTTYEHQQHFTKHITIIAISQSIFDNRNDHRVELLFSSRSIMQISYAEKDILPTELFVALEKIVKKWLGANEGENSHVVQKMTTSWTMPSDTNFATL